MQKKSALLVVAIVAISAAFLLLAWQLNALQKQISSLNDRLKVRISNSPSDVDIAKEPGDTKIRSFSDVKTVIDQFGPDAPATRIATYLADLDTWTVKPEDEARFLEFKLAVVGRLRTKVAKEVTALQEASLAAASGAEAAKRLAVAGQILSLFPMSEDSTVLNQAKLLSERQAEIAGRIDVLRRQRYNRWAADRIAAAINGYNNNSSYLSPFKENAKLVASAAKELGQIDPAMLEPAVLALYKYVIEMTNKSIAEKDKIALAKKLTSSTSARRNLGEF
jgi:hypothetical protein